MEKFFHQFVEWMNENRLLVLKVTFEKSGRKTIYGRLLQFDQKEKNLLVYVDDTKTIERFMFNQIDDIVPAKTSYVTNTL